MTKLHYVGFNGYSQCPKNEDGLSKVIEDWTSIEIDGRITAASHRLLIAQTKNALQFYGVLNTGCTKTITEVISPRCFDAVGCGDEFLLASHGVNFWKLEYRTKEWRECEVNLLKTEECLWKEDNNCVIKISFQEGLGKGICLLRNGSVWTLEEKNLELRLKLLFSNTVEKAVDVASGLEHSLILTLSGCVLSFGNGSRGQLGHGDLNPTYEPVQVAALEGLKVTKISTAGWHSCAVTDSGDLYTWGWNNYGQLAAFEDEQEVSLLPIPMLAEVGDDPEIGVANVVCGRRHTVAVLENKDLYATGWNAYRQFGLKTSEEKICRFTKIQPRIPGDGAVICGPWYTILVE